MPAYAPRTKKGKSLPKGSTAPNVGDLDLNTTSIPAVPGPGGAMSLLPYLISIYKNKAAREAATEAFKASANQLQFPIRIADAADWFASKYPRVAAHMRINPEVLSGQSSHTPSGGFAANIQTPPGKVTEPMTVNFSRRGLDALDLDPDAAFDMMAHEGTHAAQALGNSSFNQLYNAAHNLTGYQDNPFEIMAQMRGMTAGEGGTKVPRMIMQGTEPDTYVRQTALRLLEYAAAHGKAHNAPTPLLGKPEGLHAKVARTILAHRNAKVNAKR